MPTLRKQAEPEAIVQAITGATYRVRGQVYRVHGGERIRASHPLVKSRPMMFVPDGATDVELAQASQRYEAWKQAQR